MDRVEDGQVIGLSPRQPQFAGFEQQAFLSAAMNSDSSEDTTYAADTMCEEQAPFHPPRPRHFKPGHEAFSGFRGAKDKIVVSQCQAGDGFSAIALNILKNGNQEHVDGRLPLNILNRFQALSTRGVPLDKFVWGNKESPGHRSKMEDYTTVVKEVVNVPMLFSKSEARIPQAVRCQAQSATALAPDDQMEDDDSNPLVLVSQDFHYVGVYDGHGGTEVSEILAKRLHELIKQSIERESQRSSSHAYNSVAKASSLLQRRHYGTAAGTVNVGSLCNSTGREWRALQSRGKARGVEVHDSFGSQKGKSIAENMDIDEEDQQHMSAGEAPKGDASQQPQQQDSGESDFGDYFGSSVLRLSDMENAITNAFDDMNGTLPDAQEKTVGSTAVVSLIGSHHLIVANVGDSRAVMRRHGRSVRLSRDHKPDQEDEEARIQKSGGRVWDFNGRRVMGLLAMTRAFGDDCLRPYGICATPEVTILPRTKSDEFLILACDGLWDVISDEEACDLVVRCFRRAEERDATAVSACRVAASVLFRAAFAKGSHDNISVVVVDLRSHEAEQKAE